MKITVPSKSNVVILKLEKNVGMEKFEMSDKCLCLYVYFILRKK